MARSAPDGAPEAGGRPAASRLLDVAHAAGVSLRTASRVLNDDPRVAPVTRQRVREAMLDLRFQPDAMARSLRAGTGTAVGFVVESIADPFFAEVIDAVELEMSHHGRSVLVTSTRRDPAWERDVIGRMMQRRIAGLLLSPTSDDHSWLDPRRLPVVLIDRQAPGLSATWSRSTTTGPLSTPRPTSSPTGTGASPTWATRPPSRPQPPGCAVPRRPGSAPGRRGRATSPLRVATSQAAAEAVSSLIGSPGPADGHPERHHTGIAGRGAGLALGGTHRHGPVSFGDFPMADALSPAVTVVDHPGREVGRAAAARLLARLDQPGLPVQRIQVPAGIVERGSGELRR